jgi:glycolate oxidase iron-sulfur subunit
LSAPVVVPPERALPGTPLDKARPGIDTCVHCGFCLQACPTYITLEDENDSPRGRIVLMRALLEGTLPPENESVQKHIAQCLGCRSCETVCPSGVPYGHMLEATRATLARYRPIPFVARVILSAFERPWLLSLAMAGGRISRRLRVSRLLSRLPGRFGFAMAMLESTRRSARQTSAPIASDGHRGRTALLTGCVMEGLLSDINRATERVLVANDYGLEAVEGQRCCGALHAHAGDDGAARRLAKRNIEAFERANVDYICVNAAGCGAMMKEYGHLLADDAAWRERAERISAKVRDVSELLAAAGPRHGGPVRTRVAYDAPCHLMHAQRIVAPPLDVLRAIPELDLLPLNESDMCCGSAGIYNLVEPDVSDVVLDRKLANIAASGADTVATGNPGCLMQIGAGLIRARSHVNAVHPVELLDASYSKPRS